MKRTVVITFAIGFLCLGMAAMVMAEDVPPTTAGRAQATGEATAEATAEPTPLVPLGRDVAPLHPPFALLDADGNNVTGTGNSVSAMLTCGTCHDAVFITTHTKHGEGGNVAAGVLPPSSIAPASAEMNCFLCHTAAPNNSARLAALKDGDALWASTAVLVGSGIVEQSEAGFTYNPAAFDAEGMLKREYITLRDPHSDNCGSCHGLVHLDAQSPLALTLGDASQWRTFTTGQIASPQRLAASGLNLQDRASLVRPWDVHTERVLNCVDCHYSVSNPIYSRTTVGSGPSHLTFDPRRADFSEYLLRPSHEFAAGTDTMRSCDSCHDGRASHSWLPNWERHTNALACESCHVPQLYAPALASRDATVVRPDGSPVDQYRGLAGEAVQAAPSDPVSALITGYQPVLLQQQDADGTQRLSPYNLVSLWYWVAGDAASPLTADDLRAAYLDGNQYAPAIIAAFDADGDGAISETELVLDTEAKTALITARLTARGLANPRIVAEVKPFPIHHSVVGGEWATRDCQTCHTRDSRLVSAVSFGNRVPGSLTPTLADDAAVKWNGALTRDASGVLNFTPDTQTPAATLYIFGHDSEPLVDTLGVLIVLGASLGVTAHATLRLIASRRRTTHAAPAIRREYMYTLYERQWHWLQTFVIFGLTFSGLVVHRPAMFSLFSFAWMVDVHNLLAVLLVINAALALVYHLVSGEIKQFIPRPYGFFDDMVQQALYYVRGIFRGDPHPFEKRRDRKMNPIQQLTYLALLNVLLPLQIVTGVLMWGAGQFPEVTARLGGLPVLAPFHTLIAWLLVTFVIVHVYMTTTGHKPLTNLKAMIMGYDDLEAHADGDAPAPAPQSAAGR